MGTYRITYPDGFDDHAWEVESKGWYQGIVVIFEGKEYPITFYDAVRLSQDIAAELSARNFFVEPNLLVLKRIDRESIERTVQKIVDTGEIRYLKYRCSCQNPVADGKMQ